MQQLLRLGAILGGLAVLLGTFAAHGLKGRIEPADLETFEKGIRYQMFHALALLALAALAAQGMKVRAAGLAMFWGAVIFGTSLYFLTTTGPRWLGAITPIGGVLMVIGWVLLVVAAGKPAQPARQT